MGHHFAADRKFVQCIFSQTNRPWLGSADKRMAESIVPRLGFLGAGRMATALARGWMAAGLARPEHIKASDPLPTFYVVIKVVWSSQFAVLHYLRQC